MYCLVIFFFDQVYCFVNNAGVMGEKEGWRLCMDINLTGVLHGATLAFEKMGERLDFDGTSLSTPQVVHFTRAVYPYNSTFIHLSKL